MRTTSLLLSLACTAAASAQNCTPAWSDRFMHDGPNSAVHASTVFDFDGAGPQPPRLVIAGSFTRFGDRPVPRVAYWDGADWQTVGTGFSSGWVSALAVFDEDGPGPTPPKLAAAGFLFQSGSGNPISIYNNGVWQPAGSGSAFDMVGLPEPAITGRALYYCTHQGVFAYHNGQVVQIGASDQIVEAVEVIADQAMGGPAPGIYAGGSFTTIGGVPAQRLARFDGAAWSQVGEGFTDGRIMALHRYDADGSGPNPPKLAVGGQFTHLNISRNIGLWDGIGFQYFPGVTGWTSAIGSFDFDGPGPEPARLLVGGGSSTLQLHNGQWSQFGQNLNWAVDTFTAFDFDGPGPEPAHLIAGGDFTGALDSAAYPGIIHLARWRNGGWSPIRPVLNRGLDFIGEQVLSHDEDGEGPAAPYLVVAGRYNQAGGLVVNRVSRYTPQGFEPMGAGFSSSVYALSHFDPDGPGGTPPQLIAGGIFLLGGSRVAQWTNNAWVPLGSQQLITHAFAMFDPDGPGPQPRMLYAGGERLGSSGALVARWDGTMWSDTSLTTFGRVYALAVFDPDGPGPLPESLIAGGQFTMSGGISNLARFDGTTWHPLATGVSSTVYALEVFDEDDAGPNPARLFIGGQFLSAGSIQASGIVRWNGTAFSALVSPPFPPSFSQVLSLRVFDHDGPGGAAPALYLGGSFSATMFPQSSANNIARWTGAAFQPVDGGTDVHVYGMGEYDEDGAGPAPAALYVVGRFKNAGGIPSIGIARYGCPGPAFCYANCDQSTAPPVLNVNDFGCFLQRFAAGHTYANCDGSAVPPALNIADFACFLQRFAAGCN